jgi:hypothetical protein
MVMAPFTPPITSRESVVAAACIPDDRRSAGSQILDGPKSVVNSTQPSLEDLGWEC